MSEPSVSSPVALTGRSSAEDDAGGDRVLEAERGARAPSPGWPTTMVEESAKVAGCRSSGGSSRRITARSVEGSVPTTLAAKLRPSLVVTCRDSASPATWSLADRAVLVEDHTSVPWLVPEPVEERIETALGETCFGDRGPVRVRGGGRGRSRLGGLRVLRGGDRLVTLQLVIGDDAAEGEAAGEQHPGEHEGAGPAPAGSAGRAVPAFRRRTARGRRSRQRRSRERRDRTGRLWPGAVRASRFRPTARPDRSRAVGWVAPAGVAPDAAYGGAPS